VVLPLRVRLREAWTAHPAAGMVSGCYFVGFWTTNVPLCGMVLILFSWPPSMSNNPLDLKDTTDHRDRF
jgi:hypothetical protein